MQSTAPSLWRLGKRAQIWGLCQTCELTRYTRKLSPFFAFSSWEAARSQKGVKHREELKGIQQDVRCLLTELLSQELLVEPLALCVAFVFVPLMFLFCCRFHSSLLCITQTDFSADFLFPL